MPFWRGEDAPRSAELGAAVGALCPRDRRAARTTRTCSSGSPTTYQLEPDAARVLRDYVARQLRVAGAVPDDRTVLVESLPRPAGETGPGGAHARSAASSTMALKLASSGGDPRPRWASRPRVFTATRACCSAFPRPTSPPLDLFDGLTAERAEALDP